MKFFASLVVALAALVFCARETSGGSVVARDVTIESNDKNGNFNCDGLICPKNTHTCDVTKRNDPKDAKQIVRERKCLSEDRKVLQEQVVREPNKSGSSVSVYATASRDSGEGLSSEEEHQPFEQYPSDLPSDFGEDWF